jgi:aspartyl-tRNA synthetase
MVIYKGGFIMSGLGNMKRSNYCTQLSISNVGQEVTIMGWVQKRRDLGALIFADVRDRSGIVQVVFDQEISKEAFELAGSIRSEFVIGVVGIVRERQSKNPKMATGDIEIFVRELNIFSKAETTPIYIEDEDTVSEALRLKYRYLDLRKPSMQKNFMLRHKVAQATRRFLDDKGFIEVETPVLTKPTPEGARDYLVASRVHPGKFYALPQSPQLFKQILMVSGFDKYFQTVKCFRDEDLRADRQPEFTQIDCEMSFVDVDDVIAVNEEYISHIFKEILGLQVQLPIQRMTYKEAMDKYGSDKPDIRFGLEIIDVAQAASKADFKVFQDALATKGLVRGINAKGASLKLSRKDVDKLGEFIKTYGAKGLAWINLSSEGIKSPIAKFFSEEQLTELIKTMGGETGDILFFVADKPEVVYNSLGALRLQLGSQLNLIDNNEYKFLWVTEFPLLEYDEEGQRYVAKHHPFTSPMDEDMDLLETQPQDVRAKAYDLVINGYEIGGGSIRIHSQEIQQKMFKTLGFTTEDAWDKFGFFMEALKYGTPPHGGIAFGLDRLVMILLKTDNIRDVIAFPKTQNASCLMTMAPSLADYKQLEELKITVTKSEEINKA